MAATGASSSRIRGLDGLRAIAAISVALYHVASLTGHTQHGSLAAGLSQLKAGVAVFFVISGFVLYLPYARRLGRGQRLPATRVYARRRVLRIVPAYWVALTLWLVFSAAAGGDASGGGPSTSWLLDYTFGQIYSVHALSTGLGPAWSLCVEVTFYALLPVFAWGMARLVAGPGGVAGAAARRQLIAIGALAALSVEFRLGFSPSLFGRVANPDTVIASTLPALFIWFAAGMSLAVLRAEWELRPERVALLRRLAVHAWPCWIGSGALFAAAVPIQGGDLYLPLDSAGAIVAFGVAAGLLLLPLVAPHGSDAPAPALKLIGSPTLTWLGTISYGIFLFNAPAFAAVRMALYGVAPSADRVAHAGVGASLLLALVTVAAAVGLGAASWYLVEFPTQRRWAGKGTVDVRSNLLATSIRRVYKVDSCPDGRRARALHQGPSVELD